MDFIIKTLVLLLPSIQTYHYTYQATVGSVQVLLKKCSDPNKHTHTHRGTHTNAIKRHTDSLAAPTR